MGDSLQGRFVAPGSDCDDLSGLVQIQARVRFVFVAALHSW